LVSTAPLPALDCGVRPPPTRAPNPATMPTPVSHHASCARAREATLLATHARRAYTWRTGVQARAVDAPDGPGRSGAHKRRLSRTCPTASHRVGSYIGPVHGSLDGSITRSEGLVDELRTLLAAQPPQLHNMRQESAPPPAEWNHPPVSSTASFHMLHPSSQQRTGSALACGAAGS
jgi:hypothetical protein